MRRDVHPQPLIIMLLQSTNEPLQGRLPSYIFTSNTNELTLYMQLYQLSDYFSNIKLRILYSIL